MEILGIFWVASIIQPTATVAGATEYMGRRASAQEAVALKAVGADLESSALLPAWSADLETETAYQVYAQTASLVVPDLAVLLIERSEAMAFRTLDAPVETLVPTIGQAVEQFQLPEAEAPPASTATAPVATAAEAPPKSIFSAKWEDWSAVAAVRLEAPPTPSTATGAETASAVAVKTEADVESAPLPSVFVDNSCLQNVQAPYQGSPLAMKASPKLQVWMHDRFIGTVAGRAAAQKIATKLRTAVKDGKLQPEQIKPVIGQNFVGVGHRDRLFFVVDETMRPHPEVPAAMTAIEWTNNLRQAFDLAPMQLAEVQMAIKGLQETPQTLYGTASWYGPGFHGRKTANGEIFDEYALTAAHKELPFNTHLKVTNRLNGKSVVVRINDRGPYIGERSLDLSKAAAHCLGSTNSGVIPYEAVILDSVPKPQLSELTTAKLAAE